MLGCAHPAPAAQALSSASASATRSLCRSSRASSRPRRRARRCAGARRRSGNRSRSGCGCSATGAMPSRASGAACARRRQPSGRRGPSRSPTGASRSPRARVPAPPPTASSSISSNSRRVRSMLAPLTNAWKRSERISTSPATTGSCLDPAHAATASAHDALHAGDHLLGVAGLADPVVALPA